MSNTTHVVVWTVEVFDRDDGIYVFADEYDANRFQDAVRMAGGDCSLVAQTVCHRSEANALIAAELDS